MAAERVDREVRKRINAGVPGLYNAELAKINGKTLFKSGKIHNSINTLSGDELSD